MAGKSVTPPGDNQPMTYECGYAHLLREAVIIGFISTFVAALFWREMSKTLREAVRLP